MKDKTRGKLVFFPKVGNPRVIMENQTFPILQENKKRLSKEAAYQASAGKFKCLYMFTPIN